MEKRRSGSSVAAMWLRRAESIVLVLIAVVLVIIAVLLLGNSVLGLAQLAAPSSANGSIRDVAIDILDSVLLVMMTMEIVYTVAVSLESHALVAEPFLIIGAIAAIRRMLVITAESTKIQADRPAEFNSLLVELALLAFIVVAMASSIYVLRRSARFLPAAGEDREG
jgi:phosphate starvation-inducible membrane PsiE